MAKNNVPFYKMTGGGNDFVVFDNRKGALPKDYSALAKNVCRRKYAVGGDGLLVLEDSKNADFRMVYYNEDGSRAEMCGNGARCISRFAYLHKAAGAKMTFETDAGILAAEILGDLVKVKMSLPKDLKLGLTLKLDDGKELAAASINTGVPHALVMVSDLEKTDVEALGRAIRYHKQFAPAGTNANFAMRKDGHTILVRTYERGVEGETLACGTGVTASAILCGLQGDVSSPVSCVTRGGDTLKVYFEIDKNAGNGSPVREVYLEGPADVCFKGELEL